MLQSGRKCPENTDGTVNIARAIVNGFKEGVLGLKYRWERHKEERIQAWGTAWAKP